MSKESIEKLETLIKEIKEEKSQKKKRLSKKQAKKKSKQLQEPDKKKKKNRKTRTMKEKITENGSKPIYGRIHADWCGHCKSMKHDWDQLRKKTKNDMTCIDIEEKRIAKKLPKFNKLVQPNPELKPPAGYPYIFRVVNNQLEEHNGNRDIDTLYNWLHSPINTPEPNRNIHNSDENITIKI
jgi:thiol-disulfide isomerase/thioredoxin